LRQRFDVFKRPWASPRKTQVEGVDSQRFHEMKNLNFFCNGRIAHRRRLQSIAKSFIVQRNRPGGQKLKRERAVPVIDEISSLHIAIAKTEAILLDDALLPAGLLCSTVMRIFVALDLDPAIRERIQKFVEAIRIAAPDARWISGESLHVTLKFIGEQPDAAISQIEASLRSIRVESFQASLSGTGFFPTPRAARVFWIGIQAKSALTGLVNTIDESLAKLGIAKEDRAFNPHLTLARTRGGSGAPGRRKDDKSNRQFTKLQEFLVTHPAPDFGTMTAREFFLYRSQLSSKGSQYTKIARFELQPAII
jgi:2'-5' RNA ligase